MEGWLNKPVGVVMTTRGVGWLSMRPISGSGGESKAGGGCVCLLFHPFVC